VPHEDRRELRASRLLAAWIDHTDQREQNTLAMWQEVSPGTGFVMHYIIDFGDCFGSLWGSVQEARRRGFTYWLDPPQIFTDFVTFGVVERPWDRLALGPAKIALGFYSVDRFDAEEWVPRYPNPAFGRMTEHDAAWMARIVARLDQPAIEAIVGEADVEPEIRARLIPIVMGRRAKILRRYLSRLSPLADPMVRAEGPARWLCARDLAVRAGVAPSTRRYRARTIDASGAAKGALDVRLTDPGNPCARLPDPAAETVRIEITVAEGDADALPIRFHLYSASAGSYRLAGIERH
jgi:hypothetical protein